MRLFVAGCHRARQRYYYFRAWEVNEEHKKALGTAIYGGGLPEPGCENPPTTLWAVGRDHVQLMQSHPSMGPSVLPTLTYVSPDGPSSRGGGVGGSRGPTYSPADPGSFAFSTGSPGAGASFLSPAADSSSAPLRCSKCQSSNKQEKFGGIFCGDCGAKW